MSGLIDFAEKELNRLLAKCDDSESYELQKHMNEGVMDVVKAFSNAGHSGFSANYALGLINRLLNWKPITPLTGDDDEWKEIGMEGIHYQNLRCPAIFKDKDGKAYYTEAKIFSSDGGHTWYTSKDSSEYIQFPYTVPLHSEQVILDNLSNREEILKSLVEMFENICNNSIDNVNFDSKIDSYLSPEQYPILDSMITEKFNITKLLFNTADCERMWELVNLVQESDKE